ncbi:hypothetical protein A2U01_0109566, partial [Trifolium medium]|nr:hypothetical protein [Trifolium medium]
MASSTASPNSHVVIGHNTQGNPNDQRSPIRPFQLPRDPPY